MSDFKHHILQQYQEITKGLQEPVMIQQIRKRGIELFEIQGFPNQKIEKWRHKAIDTLLETHSEGFFEIQKQPDPFRPVNE